jgi:glycerol-3-phosphate acyltransferase PlsY
LEILPVIEGRPKSRPFSLSRNGLIREAIHASGFLIVFLAMYLGVYEVAFLLSLITLGYTASELARIQRMQIPFVSQITLNAATFSERYEFATAPIFFALGITLSLTLFPPPISFVSVAVLTLGDSTAAVFGQVFGETPIAVNKGKNLEGSIAGIAFAFWGAALCPCTLPLLYAFVGAIVGMFVEVLPLPINDNLSIPLVTGVVLMVLLQVF